MGDATEDSSSVVSDSPLQHLKRNPSSSSSRIVLPCAVLQLEWDWVELFARDSDWPMSHANGSFGTGLR